MSSACHGCRAPGKGPFGLGAHLDIERDDRDENYTCGDLKHVSVYGASPRIQMSVATWLSNYTIQVCVSTSTRHELHSYSTCVAPIQKELAIRTDTGYIAQQFVKVGS